MSGTIMEHESGAEQKSDREVIRGLLELARSRRRNAPLETIEFAQRALEMARSIDSEPFIANAYTWIGIGYNELGDYDKAMEHFFLSLEINEQLQRQDALANDLSNLGVVHLNLGESDKALEFQTRALEIRRQEGDPHALASSYAKLATAYLDDGEPTRALEYSRLSLELYQSLDDELHQGLMLHNIGYILRRSGQAEEAMEHLKQAMEKRRACGDPLGMARTSNEMALILKEQGKNEAALKLADEGYRISGLLHARQIQVDALEIIAGIHEQMGDFQNALSFYKQFAELKEALTGARKSLQIAELQTRYATEKQKRQIEKLKREKADLELERKESALALAVTASHELNQPLMVLRGNLEMLMMEMKETSPMQQRFIDRMETSMQRVQQVLDRMRNASNLRFEKYSDTSRMIVFDTIGTKG